MRKSEMIQHLQDEIADLRNQLAAGSKEIKLTPDSVLISDRRRYVVEGVDSGKRRVNNGKGQSTYLEEVKVTFVEKPAKAAK